jgi:UDP-N-acetylglucosamine 2-epimerase (non-hydrolysing)
MSDGFPRFAYIVGARPNFMKTAPVLAALKERFPDGRHILVHTGQHYDYVMSRIFFEELEVPEPQYMLDVGSASHAIQIARVMERLEPVLQDEQPNLVFVPGDVNSTLAATLVAAKLNLPLAHIEAGLRSFDRTMPEEINRIVADEFSAYCFAHSEDGVVNLRAEGIEEERIHLVGNTMIDALVAVERRLDPADALRRFGLEEKGYLLVTLHRPSLVDTPLLEDVLGELEEVARSLPVLFPMHPRTKARLSAAARPGRVMLVDALGYFDFLSLERTAAAVLTDSGGVQEETTYFGVPCFTLRDNTERPITVAIGTNTILGLNAKRIREIVPAMQRDREKSWGVPPLWDGHAAKRIAEIVRTSLRAEPASRSGVYRYGRLER